MSRLSRISPSLAAQVVDKAGLDAVVERLGDDNARVQAAFLNLINTALLHPSQRLLKALELDVEKVLQQVCALRSCKMGPCGLRAMRLSASTVWCLPCSPR
jgi:hypothetical protein